jgi:RNaseH domain of pPIWI_RE/MID domain of pPIWI_RE
MILHEQVDAYLQQLGLSRVSDKNLEKLSLARTNRNKKAVTSDTVWQSLKIALGSRKKVRFEVFYQSRQTAEDIWSEFVDAFGIKPIDNLDPFEPNGITVQTKDNVSVTFRAILNDYLSVEIGYGKDLQTAQTELIRKVKVEQSEIPPDSVGLSIIELKNYYSSRKRSEQMRDAKRTLRFAFAQTGRLTQFINPEDTSGSDEEKRKAEALIKTKSHAAILDARRQLGFMGNDLSAMLEEIGLKPGIQLIGLHLEVENVSLRSKKLKEEAVFFPAAVKLTIGQQQIQAATPDAKGMSGSMVWEPYYQSGLRLGSYSGSQLHMGIGNRSDGGPVLERFLEQIIQMEKDKPTVIFVPANGWRNYWKWLQDKIITFDQMKLNNSTYLPDSHALIGGNTCVIGNIRVIRYRLGEVPSYLTIDQTKEPDCQAGYGHGICKIAERVYYSIAQKPDSYQPSYNWSRFSSSALGGYSKNARMSTLIEIVPVFLQAGDDPDVYAKAFHLLRAAASHWANGFTSHPLPSHLARNLTEDYVSMRSSVSFEDEPEEE